MEAVEAELSPESICADSAPERPAQRGRRAHPDSKELILKELILSVAQITSSCNLARICCVSIERMAG